MGQIDLNDSEFTSAAGAAHGRLESASDGNEAADGSDGDDAWNDSGFSISKDILQREQAYIEKNKEIQSKAALVVKKAEQIVKQGRENLLRPVSLTKTVLDDPPESGHGSTTVDAVSKAAEDYLGPARASPTPPTGASSQSLAHIPPHPRPRRASASINRAPSVSGGPAVSVRRPAVGGSNAGARAGKVAVGPVPDDIAGFGVIAGTGRRRRASGAVRAQESTAFGPTWSAADGTLAEIAGADAIGSEATNRLLKAKLAVLQEEMAKLLKDHGLKDAAVAALEEKLKYFDDEKSKMMKSLKSMQNQLETVKKLNEEYKKRNIEILAENKSLKKDMSGFKKQYRDAESETSSKDARLHRALEEIEKLKAQQLRSSAEAKDKIDTLQRSSEKLFSDQKRLQKQKTELLAVFKKQNQLIDVLKRQKIHLEAAALLGFSEEEFVRALGCRPAAGPDI